MNTFVWKGKDPTGNLRCERVSAENAQAARATLVAHGWSEVHLVKDELFDQTSQHLEAPQEVKELVRSRTAEDEVKYIEGKAPSFWRRYGKSLLEDIWVLILPLLLLMQGIHSGKKWAIISGAVSLAVLILLFPIIAAFYSSGKRAYAQLNKAKVWSRWEEVLRCVERLRRTRQRTGIGPGEFELVRCRAQALAGLGQLPAGLDEFRRYENDPLVPRWHYLAMLSTIYDNAHEFEKAVDCRRQALMDKPQMSALWLDLAFGLARLNRPGEAREALARGKALEVTTLAVPHVSLTRGIICWREGKFAEAQPHLEKALTQLQAFLHNPIVEGTVLLTKSYLCAVCGAQGNLQAARTYFGEVEKFLEAGCEDELLDACRRPLRHAR